MILSYVIAYPCPNIMTSASKFFDGKPLNAETNFTDNFCIVIRIRTKALLGSHPKSNTKIVTKLPRDTTTVVWYTKKLRKSEDQEYKYSKTNFPLNLDYKWKLFNKMAPSTTSEDTQHGYILY